MELSLVNRHWKEGFTYGFPFHRFIYSKLKDTLSKKQIVSLVGLRRTGKTTLLKQLIDELIVSRKVPRKNIFFYTFDEPAEFQEVMNEYLRVTSIGLEADHLYIFLDEIQKLKDWQNKLKIYYDHYPNLKFIVSGSSSLFIRKNSESLAGRIIELTLLPLWFKEYLIFKGKSELAKNVKMFKAELKREWESYVSRQFIDVINGTEEERKEYLDSLAKKVIFEDISQIFPIEQPQVIWKLFKIICSQPGMLLDYHSLSSDLKINEKTLSNYVFYLEEAFLIRKLYNFSENMLTSEKKLKKVYPIASSFCESDLTKQIETAVITQIPANFFWQRTHEVDCILVDKTPFPIEVKYANLIKDKDIKGIIDFMKKFSAEKGMVLTAGIEKEGKIIYRPVWEFMLKFGDG